MRPTNVGDLVAARLGARIIHFINRTASTVGLVPSQILRQTPARVSLLIVNLGVNDIYIAPDGLVSASRGILLSPGGGSLSMNYLEDMDLVSLEWFSVCAGLANPIMTFELLLESGGKHTEAMQTAGSQP